MSQANLATTFESSKNGDLDSGDYEQPEGDLIKFLTPIGSEPGDTISKTEDRLADTEKGATNTIQFTRYIQPKQLSPIKSDPNQFTVLQQWTGYVVEVGEDTFLSRLVPVEGAGDDQEAEIYLDKIDPNDQQLVQPGAIFYWHIGYLDTPSGRYNTTSIRFRRFPAWSKRDLMEAELGVAKLKSLIDDE